jgi:hypothetical protein
LDHSIRFVESERDFTTLLKSDTMKVVRLVSMLVCGAWLVPPTTTLAVRMCEDPPTLSPTTTSTTMAPENLVSPSNIETSSNANTTTITMTNPGTLSSMITTQPTTTEPETIQIQVVFETIAANPSTSTSSMVTLLLLDAQHISILERLTRDYLRLRGAVDVQELTVLHQEITDIAGTLASLSTTTRTFQLTVLMSVTGHDVQQHVIEVLNADWVGYVTFLRIGLDDVLSAAVDNETIDTVTPVAVTSSTIGDTKHWKLLGMALTLSLLAVASVIVVRRTGRRRWRLWYKGHEYYRDRDDADNLDNHDVDADTSNSGGDVERGAVARYCHKSDSSLSLSENLEYMMDDNDNDDVDPNKERERALSEESDSGWNSALSSIQDGGTTLSSIHEGGVEDFDFDDNDDYDYDNGKYGDAEIETDHDKPAPSAVVPPTSDEEGWISSSDREAKGTLIYL